MREIIDSFPVCLESELRRAVERQDFVVYYQEIRSLGSRRITGFEALLRWRHPERGILPPAEFLPLAEETGLVIPIGWWVFHEVCRQIREWRRRLPPQSTLSVSVNLSGRQFLQPDLVQRLTDILEETCVEPSWVKLEIVETIIMEHCATIIAKLQQLRRLGVGLALDDFGTGYSSLSRLLNFPIDTLKIDRSFVQRLRPGGGECAVVSAIVTLARDLNMETVAEGVETEQQLHTLSAMGCDFAQGYLFSPPLESEAAGQLLLSGPAPPPHPPGGAAR